LIARLKEIKIFDKKWELLKDVLEPLFAKRVLVLLRTPWKGDSISMRSQFRRRYARRRGTDFVLVRRHISTGSNGGDGPGKRTVLESPKLLSKSCSPGLRREQHEARVLLLNIRVKPFILSAYNRGLVLFPTMTI